MRRLPHLATLLRPSTITDDYGDEVDGPLAPVGEPFGAWLQQQTSVTDNAGDGSPVVTRTVLYVRVSDTTPDLDEDDVIEVDGDRYAVDGKPRRPVNPRGRARFVEVDLRDVTRGGN